MITSKFFGLVYRKFCYVCSGVNQLFIQIEFYFSVILFSLSLPNIFWFGLVWAEKESFSSKTGIGEAFSF